MCNAGIARRVVSDLQAGGPCCRHGHYSNASWGLSFGKNGPLSEGASPEEVGNCEQDTDCSSKTCRARKTGCRLAPREKRDWPKSVLSGLQGKSDSKSSPWFLWPQEAFEKLSLEIPYEKFQQNRFERAYMVSYCSCCSCVNSMPSSLKLELLCKLIWLFLVKSESYYRGESEASIV